MKNRAYILSESDKTRMNRQIERLEGAPPPAMIPNPSQRTYLTPDAYWGLPPCETGLPAAERTSDGSISPGIALCCLYKYDPAYDKLMPILGPAGTPIKVLVRNAYTQVTNDFVQIWKHKNGTWTNEKPSPISTITTTHDPDQPKPFPVWCEGACIWTAATDLTWQGPVGGCRNTTTTSTTSTTSTTVAPPTTTTTLPPCPTRNCRLKCVAVSTTTPAPGQPPAPDTGYKYQVVGTTCATPCSCYGVDEPCYVLDGEIESRCVYINPTTTSSPTTTTTGAPLVGSPACARVESVIGATPAGYYRAATLVGGLGGWQICQDCLPGFVPLRPLGSDIPVDAGGTTDAIYHQSKCVRSPCDRIQLGTLDPTNLAIYVAYTYQELVSILGGIENAEDYLKTEDGKYLANWFLCSTCGASSRPLHPPKPWLYVVPGENAAAPISLTPNESNVFQYLSNCVSGPPCDSCKYLSPYTAIETTAPPLITTTPSPSTTLPPCGCEPPRYCPSVAGECVKTVCRPGGAGTITCPVTTPAPGVWCQEGCALCHCDAHGATSTSTTTTAIPCGGTCTRVWIPINAGALSGWRYLPDANTCNSLTQGRCRCNFSTPAPYTTGPGGVSSTTSTTPACGTVETVACVPYTELVSTAPPVVCASCIGVCNWGTDVAQGGEKVWVMLPWEFYGQGTSPCQPRAQGGGPCDTFRSPPQGQTNPGTSAYYTCSGWDAWFSSYFSDWAFTDSYGLCGCRRPSGPPSSYCSVAQTPCETRIVCGCCNASGCAQKCAFKGNGYGGWTKISDPCPTNCPCPTRPYQNSDDECDRIEIGCGTIVPPPSTTITSTSTTTLGPGACCYPGPVCTYGYQNSCIAANGGVWQGAGTSCAGGICNSFTTTSTTTEGPGRCCHSGTPACIQCLWTYRTFCNQLSGSFTPGVGCSGPCCNATTTSTTTPGPLGNCCQDDGYGVGNPGGPCLSSQQSNSTRCKAGTWQLGDLNCARCYGRCCITCASGLQMCFSNTVEWMCNASMISSPCGFGQPAPSYAWTAQASCVGVCNGVATTTGAPVTTEAPFIS